MQYFYEKFKEKKKKKINIVKENRDYNRIIKENRPFKYKDYVIYIDKRKPSIYRFGFSVGKKVGNAVTRNRVKRQIKAIVSQNDYQNDFDCIIIVGKGILDRSFSEMRDNLNFALKKLKLVKERKDA